MTRMSERAGEGAEGYVGGGGDGREEDRGVGEGAAKKSAAGSRFLL